MVPSSDVNVDEYLDDHILSSQEWRAPARTQFSMASWTRASRRSLRRCMYVQLWITVLLNSNYMIENALLTKWYWISTLFYPDNWWNLTPGWGWSRWIRSQRPTSRTQSPCNADPNKHFSQTSKQIIRQTSRPIIRQTNRQIIRQISRLMIR